MIRGSTMRTVVEMALLACVLSCLCAQTAPEPGIVRTIAPLKPNQHLSFLETGGNDRVIHFFADNGAREEIFAVGPLREHAPQLSFDGRKAFFLIDDWNGYNGVEDLYYLNGDNGLVRRLPGVTFVYAISPDAEFLCYNDNAYALREEKGGNPRAVRVVLFSIAQWKSVEDFYANGNFFVYTGDKPKITFDRVGSRFLFKVLQEDSHVAEYEMKVPSGATKLLSVSKDTFAAP